MARALVLFLLLVPLLASAQFSVGTADITLVDPDRGDRVIPCDLYYPATADGPGQPPADPPPGGFAAIAFGHGYQLNTGVYAWVAERLAAIGGVVALPRTAGELFPDHEEFGLDLAFVARTLRDTADGELDALTGRMSDRTLVMGHSMGGGASLLALASDPGLTAVVTFAAAETNPSAIAACASIDRPSLFFAGTNDCVTPPADHQIPMYEALAGGWRTLVTIDGASHCQFNTYSFLCALGEFCDADISRSEQHDLVWNLLEPWVRAVLLGADDQFAVFQTRLGAGAAYAYEQAGTPTSSTPTAGAGTALTVLPNPANPRATVRFTLPEAAVVDLRIVDLRGRQVRALTAGPFPPGSHAVNWDGRGDEGRAVSSGVYLVRLTAGQALTSTRLALIR